MIRIVNLNKSFGKNVVLNSINLDIPNGGVYAILGPNGSGKTTLLKSILGMVKPNSGTILINDKAIFNKWHYRSQIDYLPQIANFPNNLSVQELIDMIKDLRNDKSKNPDVLIERFQLNNFLHKKLVNLSGGTKQKVNIILSFMFDSPLLILDEPTSGLDPKALITLKKIIAEEKEKGKTILVTSHIMNFVEEIADNLIFLLEGNVYFQGSVSDLKKETNSGDFEHAIATILNSENV